MLVVRFSINSKPLSSNFGIRKEYEGIRGDCVMMDVKPLHSEQDYDWAVREVTSCEHKEIPVA
jgi:hypothetical protein